MPDDVVARALEGHKFGPDGSIFGPESLQDIRDRLTFIKDHGCPCVESPHLNALHDLAHDDVPALLVVLAQLAAKVELLRRERIEFVSRLDFGDDIHEPAAALADIVDTIEQAFSDRRDHQECPHCCEQCGESLAAKLCPECHGSGCDAALCEASGAYSECEHCGGAGWVHDGCVGMGYAELAAEVERQKAELRARISVPRVPQCAIPSHWHDDCLGAWPVITGEDPVSAWPKRDQEVADGDGDFMSIERARALAAALLNAAAAAEAVTRGDRD